MVAALDDATATRAASVLEDPATDNKYETIKDFLLAAFGLSDQQRAQQLLAYTELGDRRPSEMLDQMLRLHGKHDRGCYLLREIFLRALPLPVRRSLAHVTCELRELAAHADLSLAAEQQSHVAAIADPLTVYPVMGDRSRRRETSKNPDVCYFHRRFGDKARQCQPPCKWRQGNARAGLQH
jgi:hypothetical protein